MKGSDIKAYLVTNGLKQECIAEKAGIPGSIFCMMMNDKRKIEVNEYMKICDAIGVPLDQFRCRLPENSKPATYVTERVVNIGDLENYIEQAHLSTISIIHGIREGEIPSVFEIADHLEQIDKILEKAYNFEFCVERRTTICH